MNTTTENDATSVQPKYTVSKNTALFIDLLKQQADLHSNIADAVLEFYGCTADDIIERDFAPLFTSLRDKLFEHLSNSIYYEISTIGSTQI